MKILLFGAGGTIGREIATEAIARGHALTTASRHPSSRTVGASSVQRVEADVISPRNVARVAEGFDVLVSAVGPAHDGGSPTMLVDAARALVSGARTAHVNRVIVVGGAGSLFVKPGLRLVDTPEFPPAWRPAALAHADALDVWRGVSDIDWTYVSPAALIAPGERTEKYRTGGDDLLTDAKGESRISTQDFAIAILDEIEAAKHPKSRITVAY